MDAFYASETGIYDSISIIILSSSEATTVSSFTLKVPRDSGSIDLRTADIRLVLEIVILIPTRQSFMRRSFGRYCHCQLVVIWDAAACPSFLCTFPQIGARPKVKTNLKTGSFWLLQRMLSRNFLLVAGDFSSQVRFMGRQKGTLKTCLLTHSKDSAAGMT